MRNIKKTAAVLGVGFFCTLMISEAAWARDSHYSGSRFGRARDEIRHDMREVRQSREQLRDSVGELRRDRAELRNDVRRGAPNGEIAQGRAEVRDSRREVFEDRRELARDRAELNRDLEKYGWYRDSDGNWRRDYGWYDRGPDRDYWQRDGWERDRYGWWGWSPWWR
jgi:hypothetical protein